MSHDKSVCDVAVGVKSVCRLLTFHFRYRGGCHAEVIGRVCHTSGQDGIAKLEVGQIHVHQPVKGAHRFDRFVTACVVHNGDCKPVLAQIEGSRNFVGKLRRRNKVDVGNSRVAQVQKQVGESIDGNADPVRLDGNVEVLTKSATKIAPCEKHRPAAFCAGYRRLFPHVRGDARHSNVGHAAKARFDRAVNITFSRAKVAIHCFSVCRKAAKAFASVKMPNRSDKTLLYIIH